MQLTNAPPAVTETLVCNICGHRNFVEFRGRGKIQCHRCKSVERTRVLRLVLDRLKLKRGARVLHIAPERGIREHLRELVGSENYRAVDFNPDHYSSKTFKVEKFDLVTDSEKLPSNHFDLVLHSHVMEHLRCNVTAVLWHLHRSITPNGLHVFAVPFMPGKYASDFGTSGEQERLERFGNIDHVHNFGRDDIDLTLGMLFDLKRPNLSDEFDVETLRRHNIPERHWDRLSGSTFFVLRKNDLKLRERSTERKSSWFDRLQHRLRTRRLKQAAHLKKRV